VFPEGITINYLAGIRTPLSFHTFTPPEMSDAESEDAVIGELAAHPPECIAIIPRDVREYRRQAFGVDYDTRIAARIRAHYSEAASSSRCGTEGDAAVLLLGVLELPR